MERVLLFGPWRGEQVLTYGGQRSNLLLLLLLQILTQDSHN